MTYVSSATLGISGLTAGQYSALILSSPDLALQATLADPPLQPYTRICLRGDNTNVEVWNIIKFFTGYAGSQVSCFDPTVNIHLQDVEVWVRCAFFADYIAPASFDQDLTPDAAVAHDNLILGQGDFLRYTRDTDPLNTVIPYLPQTPPRNDITGITLVNNAGTFPVPAVTGTYATPTTTSNFPYGWANPQLETPGGSIPTGLIAVPQMGNAYVSGRIFSPTIDELWIYIKKMVDGQSGGTTLNPPIPVEPSISLPSSHTGDPLNALGTTYAKAPTTISYSVDTVITTGIADNTLTPATLGTTYAFSTYVPTSPPSPRANPYSLRELEALIRNVQYNLETTAIFFAANAVVTGNIVPTIGSLYQLHKNYTPETAGTTAALWTVANTYNAAETAANYGNVLPVTAGSYNVATNFVAGDSYLSADGQWHYLFDHVRIPVLAETY
jgi:hypothetical protein